MYVSECDVVDQENIFEKIIFRKRKVCSLKNCVNFWLPTIVFYVFMYLERWVTRRNSVPKHCLKTSVVQLHFLSLSLTDVFSCSWMCRLVYIIEILYSTGSFSRYWLKIRGTVCRSVLHVQWKESFPSCKYIWMRSRSHQWIYSEGSRKSRCTHFVNIWIFMRYILELIIASVYIYWHTSVDE